MSQDFEMLRQGLERSSLKVNEVHGLDLLTPFKVFDKCYKQFDDRDLSRIGRAQGCCQVVSWTSLLSGVRRR